MTVGDLLVPALADGRVQTTGPFPPPSQHHLTGYRVRDLMTTDPISAGTDWPLARAIAAMDLVGINRVPVVDPAGHAVGILTTTTSCGSLARRIRDPQAPRMEPD